MCVVECITSSTLCPDLLYCTLDPGHGSSRGRVQGAAEGARATPSPTQGPKEGRARHFSAEGICAEVQQAGGSLPPGGLVSPTYNDAVIFERET